MARANHRRQYSHIVASPNSSPIPHITLEFWNCGLRKKFNRFISYAVFVFPAQVVNRHVVDMDRSSQGNVVGGNPYDLAVANYPLSFVNGLQSYFMSWLYRLRHCQPGTV